MNTRIYEYMYMYIYMYMFSQTTFGAPNEWFQPNKDGSRRYRTDLGMGMHCEQN